MFCVLTSADVLGERTCVLQEQDLVGKQDRERIVHTLIKEGLPRGHEAGMAAAQISVSGK